MKKKRQFRHLNQCDRDRIQALCDAGHINTQIATILGVHKSTIAREINKRKRKNGRYSATTAQLKAGVKRANSKYCGMKIEHYPALKQRIIEELKLSRSPDEIAGRMEKENMRPRVIDNTIYKWLYSVYGQRYCRYLCTKRFKRKKQKNKPKREMIPNRVSLKQRQKQGIHAEGDLFVSPTKTGSKHSGAIICIPEAQLLVATMIPNKKPATMVQAVQTLLKRISVDDLTLDNGIENKNHEQFGIPTYFTDPYSPWQKPHVENNIGLIRRWFIPKKTDLKTVPEEDMQRYADILNRKYRKSLGYRSAYEVAYERGMIQKIPALKRVYS